MTNVDLRTLVRIAYQLDRKLAPSQILDGLERRDAAATMAAVENHLGRIHKTTLAVMGG